jgi:hypothetical protein
MLSLQQNINNYLYINTKLKLRKALPFAFNPSSKVLITYVLIIIFVLCSQRCMLVVEGHTVMIIYFLPRQNRLAIQSKLYQRFMREESRLHQEVLN